MKKVSLDTALRDIKDLIAKGLHKESSAGGRIVNYEICVPEQSPCLQIHGLPQINKSRYCQEQPIRKQSQS